MIPSACPAIGPSLKAYCSPVSGLRVTRLNPARSIHSASKALEDVAGLEDAACPTFHSLADLAAPRVCDTPRAQVAEYRGTEIVAGRLGLARLQKRDVNAAVDALAERRSIAGAPRHATTAMIEIDHQIGMPPLADCHRRPQAIPYRFNDTVDLLSSAIVEGVRDADLDQCVVERLAGCPDGLALHVCEPAQFLDLLGDEFADCAGDVIGDHVDALRRAAREHQRRPGTALLNGVTAAHHTHL